MAECRRPPNLSRPWLRGFRSGSKHGSKACGGHGSAVSDLDANLSELVAAAMVGKWASKMDGDGGHDRVGRCSAGEMVAVMETKREKSVLMSFAIAVLHLQICGRARGQGLAARTTKWVGLGGSAWTRPSFDDQSGLPLKALSSSLGSSMVAEDELNSFSADCCGHGGSGRLRMVVAAAWAVEKAKLRPSGG